MSRILKIHSMGTWAFCFLLGAAVAVAPVRAQDYSDGWSLDPADDPLLEDDDDDGGDDDDDELYYRDVNTGEIKVYTGRDDSVSGIAPSKVVRPDPAAKVEAKVESTEEWNDDGKTHGKHRRVHSERRTETRSEEKPKSGSGGVGAASDDESKDE